MTPVYLKEGPNNQEILDVCMDMALDLGAEVFVRHTRALRDRGGAPEILKTINVPTLVVCGRDDRLCTVSSHQIMHEFIANSEFKIVEGAGHLPTYEQPEKK